MACTFEIYKDKSGKFRYRMRAANKEIILSGQAYKSKASCKNGIASVSYTHLTLPTTPYV